MFAGFFFILEDLIPFIDVYITLRLYYVNLRYVNVTFTSFMFTWNVLDLYMFAFYSRIV